MVIYVIIPEDFGTGVADAFKDGRPRGIVTVHQYGRQLKWRENNRETTKRFCLRESAKKGMTSRNEGSWAADQNK